MISAKDIEGLFGEFLERIEDAELRRKTVDCWVAGCEKGGWQTVAELAKMPFTLLTDAGGMGFVEHTKAVTAGSIGLAQALLDHGGELPYEIDLDFIVAGGLLHDLGKLFEIEADGEGGYRKSHSGRCARHPVGGAILAGRLGVPEEVINIIACHSKEGDGRPKRVETILVKQADFATFDPLVMLNNGTLITDKA